jgi:hypothetical protein
MRWLDVYYAKAPSFMVEEIPTREALEKTHTFVARLFGDLDTVFTQMQGEVWSPEGEARPLIEALGLRHTSMSVGDVALDPVTGEVFVCDMTGWKDVSDAFTG